MSTIQMEGLWQFIQTMSLSKKNRLWLADRLTESTKEVKMDVPTVEKSACYPKTYSQQRADEFVALCAREESPLSDAEILAECKSARQSLYQSNK